MASRPVGPASRASLGSHPTTSASRCDISAEATYGGLDTTRSMRPAKVARQRRPPRTFRQVDPGSGPASRPGPDWRRPPPGRPPRGPSPTPRPGPARPRGPARWPPSPSRDRRRSIGRVAADPAVAGHRPSDRARARAASTTCSVSGRGMRTRVSTIRLSVLNPHRPITYCSGSRAARRATRVLEALPGLVAHEAGRPALPGDLLDEPPRFCVRPQPGGGGGPKLRPRRRSGRCPPASDGLVVTGLVVTGLVVTGRRRQP